MSATFMRPTPEMRKAARRATASRFTLYWPGDQWFHDECAGHGWWIPPDQGGKLVPHPVERNEAGAPLMVVADGRKVVADRYGVIYSKKAEPVNGAWQRKVVDPDGPLEGQTAEDIVTFFTRKHERLGLVELTLNPEMDAMIIMDAKERNLNANREWAQQELNARREVIDTFRKNNPGAPVSATTPPTPNQIRAEIVMLRLENRNAASAALYKCECNMFEIDDFELFKLHKQARHGESVEAPELGVPEPEPEIVQGDAPIKRGPRGPYKKREASETE